MAEWIDTTLGEFLVLQRGHDLPKSQRLAGEVPVVGSGGITGLHNEAKVSGPGVTIGRAANLGVPTFVEQDFWPLNTTLYVRDFRGSNARFVFHLFQVLDLTGFNSGSVQPMLNRNYIASLPIRVPSRRGQDAIAEVLGVLDDKIAVNERIAEVSRDLAESLYLQALAPSGSWEMRELGTVASVVMGQSPPGEAVNRTGEGRALLNGPTEFGRHSPTPAQWTSVSPRVCEKNDLLLCVRGSTTGRMNWADRAYAIGRGLGAIRAKASVEETSLIRLSLSRGMDGLLARANGSVFPNLSRDVILGFPIPWPEVENRTRLVKVVSDFDADAAARAEESSTLATLRDTLLPQLMSGRLRVKDAEKIVEDHV
ncbi:restriction endonuclease subunit S [Streptomyces rochei]|uniref:restriction endonuclease subunit S n=1 Tax=Streptomyces rochei TaxID=1928 RepID=UPI003466C061